MQDLYENSIRSDYMIKFLNRATMGVSAQIRFKSVNQR
jgi:hypothetical protein